MTGNIKYNLDPKHEDDLLPTDTTDTSVKSQIQDLLQCNIDLDEVRQLQAQDPHLSKIITRCTSHSHHNKTPYYLDESMIVYRKVRDGLNIFHAIMFPQLLQPYILYESHNVLGHNGSTRLYTFIK